jgi:hypothetical protein
MPSIRKARFRQAIFVPFTLITSQILNDVPVSFAIAGILMTIVVPDAETTAVPSGNFVVVRHS